MAFAMNGTQSLSVSAIPLPSVAPPFTLGAWVYVDWDTAGTPSYSAVQIVDSAFPLRHHEISVTIQQSPATDNFSATSRSGIATLGSATRAINKVGTEWVFICGRWSATNARNVRVQGGTGSDTTSVSPSISNRKTIIGSGGAGALVGRIAEVMMWDRVITDAEVDIIAGINPFPSWRSGVDPRMSADRNLTAHWTLLSGLLYCPVSGLTLTANGSPSIADGPLVYRKRHRQVLH